MATNDSRIRLISLGNTRQEVKFKGHCNTHLQIMPSFEPHHELILSGSEDGFVYIWDQGSLKQRKRKSETENENNKKIGDKGQLSNQYHYAYTGKKEKKFESFAPFIKKEKKKKTKCITNVSLFAPQSTIQAAQSIFTEFLSSELLRPELKQA